MKSSIKHIEKKADHESSKIPAKSGFLRRFLDWIARGADRQNMGGASCPS
jgi:hypothetical protein